MLWIVAAPGESLTPEIADQCRGYNVLVVNDAWRLLPWAKILYAADAAWWQYYRGVPEFQGEKWSIYGEEFLPPATGYGLNLMHGVKGYGLGFSFNPLMIHGGGNSGFQGVNLALLLGANPVVMVGFDMRGKHFFGDHPQFPRRAPGKTNYPSWIRRFETAAELLPSHIKIINATEGSALTCFPMMPLSEALK